MPQGTVRHERARLSTPVPDNRNGLHAMNRPSRHLGPARSFALSALCVAAALSQTANAAIELTDDAGNAVRIKKDHSADDASGAAGRGTAPGR